RQRDAGLPGGPQTGQDGLAHLGDGGAGVRRLPRASLAAGGRGKPRFLLRNGRLQPRAHLSGRPVRRHRGGRIRSGAGLRVQPAAREYACRRRQFGRAIAEFQAVRHALVYMYVLLEQARLLFLQACARYGGAGGPLAASMAKLAAAEMVTKVTSMAVQILGGYGYVADYPVERYFRDARLYPIGGGTSEIQKEIIARRLGLAAAD